METSLLEQTTDTIRLILGLGNVGSRYEQTRHNVGFDVVALVAAELGATGRPSTDLYQWAEARLGDHRLILARPTTLMNRSGLAAAALLDRFVLGSGEMLVVTDDFNLPLGRLRLRMAGSDGGQNGLRSVIYELGTELFPRLRVGIGPPRADLDPADFVLSRFARRRSSWPKKLLPARQKPLYWRFIAPSRR